MCAMCLNEEGAEMRALLKNPFFFFFSLCSLSLLVGDILILGIDGKPIPELRLLRALAATERSAVKARKQGTEHLTSIFFAVQNLFVQCGCLALIGEGNANHAFL